MYGYSYIIIRKVLIGWVDMKKISCFEFGVLVKDFCFVRRDVGDRR